MSAHIDLDPLLSKAEAEKERLHPIELYTAVEAAFGT